MHPVYSPSGDVIAFLRDIDGDERFHIWLWDRSGGGERRVTTEPIARGQRLAWAPDGRRLTYRSHEDGGNGFWTIDIHSGERHLVVSHIRHILDSFPSWSRDGRIIAFHARSDDGNVRLYVAPADGAREPSVIETHPGTLARATSPAWGPRDEWLAFSTTLRGRSEVAVIPMSDGRATGEVRYLTDVEADESLPTARPRWGHTGRILHCRSVDSTVLARRADPDSGTDEPVVEGQGVCYDIAEAADGTLAYAWSTPTSPPEIYVQQRGTTPRALTRSLPADIDSRMLATPRHVWYPGADGLETPAILWMPPEQARTPGELPPAVVHAHGGGTFQHFQTWDPIAHWFTNNGYVVLQVNARGSHGYGPAFFDLHRGDWVGKDLEDHARGADWLEREGVADGSRITIYGSSGGGYIAAMALAREPERWAAGCTARGISSLETLYRTTTTELRHLLESEMGTPQTHPELFQDRSPLTHVDQIRAPLLILHGKQDPRIPVSEAEQLATALHDRGRTYELHIYPDEGHGYRNMRNLCDAFVRTAAFFDEHVRRSKDSARQSTQ